MLRLLVIGVTLWQSSANSNANADSSSKNKFPVQLVDDTAEPRPGEGLGGVSVLLKPMPEATTMKTWSFLKESMLKIGEQVKQIMQVRNDMAMLQEDLTAQEKLWHQAEIELNEENGKLRAEAEKLKKEAHAGAGVKLELIKVQQVLEEEQRRAEFWEKEEDLAEKRWKSESGFLNARKTNLTELHREVNETAGVEVAKVEAIHLQLQKDQVTLRLAAQEFKDRIANNEDKMAFDNHKSQNQQSELRRQIAAMQQGLVRIQAKLKPRHIFDTEESSLKNELKQDTSTIIMAQSEQQQIVASCKKSMEEQEAIRCSEEAKLRVRLQEKSQFCNAIEVQHQVLNQDLNKCGISVGQPGGQAPIAPSGLVQPQVPLVVPPLLTGDTERTLQVPSPPPPGELPPPAPAPSY